MMKMTKALFFAGMVFLAGCKPASPSDSVSSLVSHPDRLRKVERQCSDGYAKMSVAECNAASEARHRLFMGNGKPTYTPAKKPPKF
jgi:hypothetical protein